MKILNLYSGIGGNRKLWGDTHIIDAVEYNPEIAEVYSDYFPNDNIIIGDAHQFLLENYMNYDFIWSSPPCPTHSRARYAIVAGNGSETMKAKYPDMQLYQEIILLQSLYKGGYCVENVIPYYKSLIPAQLRDRHSFWANFYITELPNQPSKHQMPISQQQKLLGYNLSKYKGIDKRLVLRNCVMPEVGKHILNCYINQSPDLFNNNAYNLCLQRI